jgi:hypothetical protein
MKTLFRSIPFIVGLSLFGVIGHSFTDSLNYANSVVVANNAQTIATKTQYSDCFSGGPTQCGDAEELRELQSGAAKEAAQ